MKYVYILNDCHVNNTNNKPEFIFEAIKKFYYALKNIRLFQSVLRMKLDECTQKYKFI